MTVHLDSLSHSYNGHPAIRELSFAVGEGELFGLLGPNGAGKSTTLSILSTLHRPDQGDAVVFGKSLLREPREIRRLVGLVPQSLAVYPGLTGHANVNFFGQLYGLRGKHLRAASDRVLELVGLTGRSRDPASSYSGGMLRRLNLACSLVHAPRLLLLDEPTVGVDPQSRERLLATIRAIADEGTTVIYTTHYMEEAQRLCDRVAILDEGRVIALGAVSELLDILGTGEVIELSIRERLLDRAALAGLPGFIESNQEGNSLRIFVKSAARTVTVLGSVLDADAIEAMRVYPVDLEGVFLHLTGRSLRDE
jgi:ABC-2 type transport system ATP-binding protein